MKNDDDDDDDSINNDFGCKMESVIGLGETVLDNLNVNHHGGQLENELTRVSLD